MSRRIAAQRTELTHTGDVAFGNKSAGGGGTARDRGGGRHVSAA